MHTMHNPATVAAPASSYSHGIETKPNARWLHISGQVGLLPDGKVAKGAVAQAEACWANIANILKAADMGMDDLVKLTTYVCNARDIPAVRAARDKYIGNARPASTLVVVAGLASSDWLIEIEAVAART
ncbi:MAG TPA: RidA family protein [Alphaproteobacteria bacterium]|nr:RidA family protein [Alphaproteobacteria bacterium]